MAQWRIKELSVMAGVSVRMLHHYDKIGLLAPSMRAPNGYRWYSEADLARLQQIIAFKFFGFDLKQIKTMLDQAPDMREQLRAQQRMLAEQTEHLRHVQKALDAILQEGGKRANPFDWNNTVTLIERYHMIDELKDTWVGKLRPEQQARYVEFKKVHAKAAVAWEKMVAAINSLQLGDPEGADGERAVKVFLAYAAAQREWEKARQNERLTQIDADQMLKDIERFRVEGVPLSSEGNAWFAQAQVAYHLHAWELLHQEISKNLTVDPMGAVGKKLANRWRERVLEQSMSEDTDFAYGCALLLDAARNRAGLKDMAKCPKTPFDKNDVKMLLDPMALDWIMRALRAN